jgi:ferredoxin-NADP reductase
LAPWRPGAHIDVHLASEPRLIRQFSLCGDPDDRSCYRVAVLRERGGGRGGSRYIHETIRPGHSMIVDQPRNHFELVEAPRYLFLAGGIGITPLLPMIAEVDRRGAAWELHYGGRSSGSMAFLDELAPYGDRVHAVLGEPLEVEVLLRKAAPDTLVYACGPQGLLDAVESLAHLLPEGAIRLERFGAPTQGAGAKGDSAGREGQLDGAAGRPGCVAAGDVRAVGYGGDGRCRRAHPHRPGEGWRRHGELVPGGGLRDVRDHSDPGCT